jgi:hypothetical protein
MSVTAIPSPASLLSRLRSRLVSSALRWLVSQPEFESFREQIVEEAVRDAGGRETSTRPVRPK